MQTLLKHSKNSKLPLCPFLKAQISSHLHEMLTQVNNYLLHQSYQISNCAAKAFYSCPAIISQRPESQKISKEPQENPEEESRII